MSRIGKLPIAVPAGVTVEVSEGVVRASKQAGGQKIELSERIPPQVSVELEGSELRVVRAGDDRTSRAMHGLARSLLNNLIVGVSQGFSTTLEIIGVGYRVEQKEGYLIFGLGYSHAIHYEVPVGVTAVIDKDNKSRLTLSSADRQLLGATAAKIRSFRPPEPYKGKGIKYLDEVIRRKEGKSGGR